MPPEVFYVFKQYLYLVRLSWPRLNEKIDEDYDILDYNEMTSDRFYSIYMQSSDYTHFFARNLAIVIFTALLIVAVWILFAIVDYILCCKNSQQV